jgi:cell division protein FtsN
MSRDYAKKNKTRAKPRKKAAVKRIRKGRYIFFVLALSCMAFYRYSSLDFNKMQKDLYKTIDSSQKISKRLPKPTFEFYTRLPKAQESTRIVQSSPSELDNNKKEMTKLNNLHNYLIQVASFKKFTDADRLRASLILQGYQAKLSKFQNNATTWYRVEIGPFKSLQQAKQKQSLLEKLNHAGLIKQLA